MIGLIAVGSETTRLSAETIGNTWKSVLARMEQVKAGANIDDEGEAINNVEKVLNKFGIQLRDTNSEFRNMEDVLDEVGNKWQSFDSVAQAQIATAIAGTHRINTFVATMENYNTVLKYSEESQNAAGTSAQKYTAYMDSIDAKLNTLTATWEQFVNNLNQSGTIKSVIDLGTKLIGILDTLINKMGLLKVAIPVVATLTLLSQLKKLMSYLSLVGKSAQTFNTVLGKIGKTGSISEEIIRELGLSLAGLSAKQQMALLSSTSLTQAQKMAALQASGLSAAEAALRLQTEAYTATNLIAVGGVEALKASLSGLLTIIQANPIGIIVGLVAGAGALISGLAEKTARETQEMIDKAEELKTSYSTFTSQSKSSVSTLTSLKDEFARLSQGVSDYGANISLSAEDYSRYKDIVAQVVELSPSLITGYDKEGAAIANKNGLIEKAIDLQQRQAEIERERFVDEDIADIAKGEVAKLDKLIKERNDLLLNVKSIGFQMLYGQDTKKPGEAGATEYYADLAKAVGMTGEKAAQEFQELFNDETLESSQRLRELLYNNIDNIYKMIVEDTDHYTEDVLNKTRDFLIKRNRLEGEISQQSTAMTSSLQIVPQVADGYEALSDAEKNFVSQYINTFKLVGSSTKDATTQIDEARNKILTFVHVLSNASEATKISISDLFSLDSDDMSAEKYKDQVSSLIDKIVSSLELTTDEQDQIRLDLKVAFGISVVDENGNEIDTQQQMIDSLTDKYDFFSEMDTSDWTIGDFKTALSIDDNSIESAEDLTAAMQELKNTTEETIPTFEELQSKINSALTTVSDEFKATEDNYSTLKTAMTEFNEQGIISADTLKKIAENDLLQYLEIVNGKVQINTQALSDNIAKAKAKAKADVLITTYNKLLALSENNVTESSNVAAEAAEDTATSVRILSSAFGEAAISGASATAILNAWSTTAGKAIPKENAQDMLDAVNDMQTAFGFINNLDLSGGSSGGGSSSSASNKIKQQKQNIEDLIEAFIKMYKQQLKEEKEAENSRYEQVKRDYEDEQTAQKIKFEDAKQNIQDLRDLEKEAYQDRLDSLEIEYKAYTKKLDAEKDLLKAKKEEADYEKSLAEKTKGVAQIQSELAKLQFDDSIEAQKKRIQLMEQLSEKQSDLDEFQSDHQYDLAEDAIDKESDRYKDLYDERKKAIEDERDARDKFYEDELDALDRAQTKWQRDFDYRKQQDQRWHEDKINQIEAEINDEVTLRAQAIEAIESRNQEAYQKLIEWNRVYGTGIDYDITQKWNVAMAALDEYGKKGIGVQGILDILAQKVDEIASKTSSAGSSFKTWNDSLNDTKSSLVEIATRMRKVNELLKEAGAFDGIPIHGEPSNRPNNVKKEMFTKNHTGTDYVSMNANDRLLNKSLGLKSDEVVRILKVGEAVVPKERNLKRLRENSLFAETSAERRASELTEGSRGYVADNSSHINVSIGDTIVQGNADNNVVSKLNDYKKSIVNEVFTKINKHTDLSGFRSVKKYV